MRGYALYRLPHSSCCQFIRGEVVELDDVSKLTDCKGFVVAPFHVDERHPVSVIRPDCCRWATPVADVASDYPDIDRMLLNAIGGMQPEGESGSRDDYHDDFNRFHERLLQGAFQKLVLSRTQDFRKRHQKISLVRLFMEACTSYPRLFIALTYTPSSGIWLVASPEILLEGSADTWLTTALAGTTPLQDTSQTADLNRVEWSEKNRQEQQYVATYIRTILEEHSFGLEETAPHTVRAAHLAHLRTDFSFHINSAHVGKLLQALHPTPAVCGLPKAEAARFILDNEHTPRTYYSGFMGPFRVHYMNQDAPVTHLYVSLRCTQIFQDDFRLYAGGGLLKDSVEEQEWQETEAKLDTMRHIIYNNV